MGFMEDLGRSNALGSVNNLMGKAIELRQGEDKSAERAYTMGLQTEELGIKKAEAERESTKFQWAAEEQAKKQKWAKSVMPVDVVLQNARPGSRDFLIQLGKQNGWIKDIGGNLVISNENMANAKKMLGERLDITKQVALIDIDDIKKEVDPLKQELAELMGAKPDDKKIPILQQRIAGLEKQKTEHLNSVLALDVEHQKKLQEQKAKREKEIVMSKAGAVLQRQEDGSFKEIVSPPAAELKTNEDRFVGEKAAAYKLETGREMGPKDRAAKRLEYHRNPAMNTAREAVAQDRKIKQLHTDFNTRTTGIYRKYGLTGDQITKILDGDTGVITNKLNPDQAKALDADIGKALKDYDDNRELLDGTRPMGTSNAPTRPPSAEYQQFKEAYELITKHPKLSNAERDKRLKQLTDKAREMRLID